MNVPQQKNRIRKKKFKIYSSKS